MIKVPKEGNHYVDGVTFWFFNGKEWEKFFWHNGKPYSHQELEELIRDLEIYLS